MKTREEIEAMSPKELQIKTAELCGAEWRNVPKRLREKYSFCPSKILSFYPLGENEVMPIAEDGEPFVGRDVPDYLNDLNAMKTAIEWIPMNSHKAFLAALRAVTLDEADALGQTFALVTSTARDRNLAFLIVMLS